MASARRPLPGRVCTSPKAKVGRGQIRRATANGFFQRASASRMRQGYLHALGNRSIICLGRGPCHAGPAKCAEWPASPRPPPAGAATHRAGLPAPPPPPGPLFLGGGGGGGGAVRPQRPLDREAQCVQMDRGCREEGRCSTDARLSRTDLFFVSVGGKRAGRGRGTGLGGWGSARGFVVMERLGRRRRGLGREGIRLKPRCFAERSCGGRVRQGCGVPGPWRKAEEDWKKLESGAAEQEKGRVAWVRTD